MADLILKDEVYAIIGAAMEVHRDKGCGFSEPIYQECMEIELAERKILINFGATSLEWKRIVLTRDAPESTDLQSRSRD